jgi:hypothetical protein
MKQKTICPSLQELIGWTQGDLPFERATAIQAHIQICKKCAAEALMAGALRMADKRHDAEPLSTAATSCFDEKTLMEFANGNSITKAGRQDMVEHLAQCTRCRTLSVSLLHERAMLNSEQPEVTNRESWRLRLYEFIYRLFPRPAPLRGIAIGSAVIIIAVVTIFAVRHNNEIWITPKVDIRGGEDSATRRFMLKAPADGLMLKKDDTLQFAWPAIAGALKYHFIVYSADGVVIWETTTESNQIIFNERTLLQTGKTYFWRVEASLGTGRPLLSEVRSFSISDD